MNDENKKCDSCGRQEKLYKIQQTDLRTQEQLTSIVNWCKKCYNIHSQNNYVPVVKWNADTGKPTVSKTERVEE